MHNYFLCVISFLCFLHTGLLAENCSYDVFGKRSTLNVTAGGSLSLYCVVQHCGNNWTGQWMWKNSTDSRIRPVEKSVRVNEAKVTLSANETQLILKFLSISTLDEGSYRCTVQWRQGGTSEGHFIEVKVFEDVPSQRSIFHRLLVYAGASLCLPLILGLARCLSSGVKSQPLPRSLSTDVVVYRDEPDPAPQPPPRCPIPQKRSTSSHKAPPKTQQKTEVVYADISQDALRQQQNATREPEQSTIYSSVKFS